MSKEERYYFDSYDYIVDRQKIINGEEDITVCDFCDWGKIVNILNEQDQKIADLETKLAESEKEKDYYQDLYFTSVKGQEKLKQQLADKDEEIEKMRYFKVTVGTIESNQIDLSSATYIIQPKIDYAVEQLRKAKYLITQKYRFDVEESDFAVAYEDDIDKIFDQLITEMKEKMKSE